MVEWKFFLFLQHNFEAIHNKDYSVVKTFKAGIFSSPSFIETVYLEIFAIK